MSLIQCNKVSMRPEKAVEDEEEVEADDGDDLFKSTLGRKLGLS